MRGLRDGAVDLWDPSDPWAPPTAPSILIADPDGLLDMDLRPDGRELAIVSGLGALKRYEISLGAPKGSPSARAVPEGAAGRTPSDVWKAAYSPDGQRLAISDSAGTLTLLDLASDQLAICSADSPAQPVRLRFSGPSLGLVGVSDFNFKLRAWRSGDCGSETAFILDPRATVWDFLFTRGGEYLVTASEDGTLSLWDATRAGALHSREVPGVVLNQIAESGGGPFGSAPGGERMGVVTAAWDREDPNHGRLTHWAIARPAETDELVHAKAPKGERVPAGELLRRARDLAKVKPRFPENQTLSCPGPGGDP
jgi:WD40 repeat protein